MAITKIDSSMLEDVSGADNLVKLDANAKIPAGTGANLLNKPGPFTSASDPAIDSNKALGTEWLNSTSGEMYICTDATAGANVWTNVGAGSGDVSPVPMWQGESYGYRAGGFNWIGSSPWYGKTNVIERFSFTSDGNATDVGDQAKNGSIGGIAAAGGASSKTHGYTGGGTGAANSTPAWGYFTDIEKWAFASATTNAVKIGDRVGIGQCAGHSSDTHGYCSSDGTGPSPSNSTIDKWTFAADNDATDVGSLAVTTYAVGGTSSASYGYTVGGSGPNNHIQKFSFVSDGNATDSGNLIGIRYAPSCSASETHGYASGGYSTTNPGTNTIQKWAVASDSDAVDVADMTQAGRAARGTSSTTHGYNVGLRTGSPGPYLNTIEKFPFASDSNATDVGDLSQGVHDCATCSY